jgi:hypothetical protein
MNSLVRAFLFCLLSWANANPVAREDFAARNLRTIERIYNLTVYPFNLPIIQKGASAVPPDLFSDKVVGRVTPVGNFTGFTDSIEYFFGLAPTPDTNAVGFAFWRADVTEFSSQCPEIASSVVNLRTAKIGKDGKIVPNSGYETTLKQIAFFKFDSAGKVIAYDAWIPNLQRWTEIANGIPFDSALVGYALPAVLCPQIQKRCTGQNSQFNNSASCILRLGQKPTGHFDEAWGDNMVCRLIHFQLTAVRPEAHCPHVGNLGGNAPNNWKCVDTTYDDSYTDDEALFGSKTPFKCATST